MGLAPQAVFDAVHLPAIIEAKNQGYAGIRVDLGIQSVMWGDDIKARQTYLLYELIFRAAFVRGLKVMIQLQGGKPGQAVDWWPEYDRERVLDAWCRAESLLLWCAFKSGKSRTWCLSQRHHEEAYGGKVKNDLIDEGVWDARAKAWVAYTTTPFEGKTITPGLELDETAEIDEITQIGPMPGDYWGFEQYLSRIPGESDASFIARNVESCRNRVTRLRAIEAKPCVVVETGERNGTIGKTLALELDKIAYVEVVNVFCLEGWG